MGLNVVPARLNDAIPKAIVTAPAAAKLTAKKLRAGNTNSNAGRAHETSHKSAAVTRTTASGGIFNSRTFNGANRSEKKLFYSVNNKAPNPFRHRLFVTVFLLLSNSGEKRGRHRGYRGRKCAAFAVCGSGKIGEIVERRRLSIALNWRSVSR